MTERLRQLDVNLFQIAFPLALLLQEYHLSFPRVRVAFVFY